ncbi:SirB2 family protein [Marinospirillum sp.]|uniref:SirB2 family protein n=1 Tax=Marinospirillum sp. TaxID=2183934 RepID=UPI003A83596A
MSYMALKHLHLMVVGLTLVFFVLRSGGLLIGMQWVGRTWARIVHHVIDLTILASALGLAAHLSQWPFYNSAWMTAKLLALVGYMLLTAIAIRRQKALLLLPALVLVLYAGWVGVSKTPLPF